MVAAVLLLLPTDENDPLLCRPPTAGAAADGAAGNVAGTFTGGGKVVVAGDFCGEVDLLLLLLLMVMVWPPPSKVLIDGAEAIGGVALAPGRCGAVEFDSENGSSSSSTNFARTAATTPPSSSSPSRLKMAWCCGGESLNCADNPVAIGFPWLLACSKLSSAKHKKNFFLQKLWGEKNRIAF